ncbi:MAG: hypothetical protein K1X79_07355 [Oligoflexia bacterium]|nr:hypothetical protein [Oligoflexia bacterium]
MFYSTLMVGDYTSYLAHPLVRQARTLLREKLPKSLLYHTAAHTDDVIKEALLFAGHDGLSERQVELLLIAAAFHDTGFTAQLTENEALGAELAEKAMLAQGGYSDAEIAQVRQAILDTKLQFLADGPRQVPSTELSKYLCDADVSNLGRPDFADKSELYRQELGKSPEDFYGAFTIHFLESHRWHTPAARQLRQSGKDANLKSLRGRMENFADDE